jgi:putative zinc finger protein
VKRPQKPGADPFTTFDAAYVLGALSPEDRVAFEEHLASCESCAASVRTLAGLPGLLTQVDADQLGVDQPAPEVLPQLLTEVRRIRRRRWIATATAGAVGLAACLAIALVPLLPAVPRGEEMIALGPYPVQASIDLIDTAVGTRVAMSCSYQGDKGGDYVLVAMQRDGRAAELATWYAMPQNTAELELTTPLRRAEISSLELRIPDGPTLMRLPVSY